MIRNIEFSDAGFLIIQGACDHSSSDLIGSRHHIQLCTVSGSHNSTEKVIYISRYEVSPDDIHKFACKIYNGEHCSLFFSLMNTKIVVSKQPIRQFNKTGNDDDGVEDSLLVSPTPNIIQLDNSDEDGDEEYELMPSVSQQESFKTQKIIGNFGEYAGDVYFELPTASLKFSLSRTSRDSLGTAILSLVNLRKSLPNIIDDKELVRVRDHPIVNPVLKDGSIPPRPPIPSQRRSMTTADLGDHLVQKSTARPKYHSNSELNRPAYSPVISSPLRSAPILTTPVPFSSPPAPPQPFHSSSANLTPDTSSHFEDRFTSITEKNEKRRSVIMKTPPPARPQSQHPSQSPQSLPASPKPSFDHSPSSPVRWLKRHTKIDHL